MGAVSSEKSVLKLVHPGGYVEILREPIAAAEVIKKNPRHSVTRPDVFEYPWIVVKPESILNLGRVFYIVPNRTIYHLLKVKGSPNQNQSLLLEGTSPLKSYAGITPKHQEHSKFITQHPLPTLSLTAPSPQEKSYDKRVRKSSQVYSCSPDMIVKRKYTHHEIELQHGKEVTRLKSCLRKENGIRRSLNFSVSFVLPVKDEELQITTTDSSTELPGFLTF